MHAKRAKVRLNEPKFFAYASFRSLALYFPALCAFVSLSVYPALFNIIRTSLSYEMPITPACAGKSLTSVIPGLVLISKT